MSLVLLADDTTPSARPIGLIQSYVLPDHPEDVEQLSTVMAVPPHAGSIDYFIDGPLHVIMGLDRP